MCDNAKESIENSRSLKIEIKETKEGSGRKLIKSGASERLWDDCLKLESYIRSNTADGIYKLWRSTQNDYIQRDIQH